MGDSKRNENESLIPFQQYLILFPNYQIPKSYINT